MTVSGGAADASGSPGITVMGVGGGFPFSKGVLSQSLLATAMDADRRFKGACAEACAGCW
jgi:hypothetical protein